LLLTARAIFTTNRNEMNERDLGRFDHLLLVAVMRLGDGAYGMTIRRELAEHTGRDVAVGAIYTALARLETRGFVRSQLGDPTPERGGRAKRFYRVLPAGSRAVEKAEAAFIALGRELGRDAGRS
jgi:PadR family transcriptional regulator, regulatory protein PadR